MELKCQLDATDDIYCRFDCLLNMFRAPLCPSSGAREYYTDGRCLWYSVLWFSNCRYGVELRVGIMMGIMVPETCWASNQICNKYHLLHLVGILVPHIEVTDIFRQVDFKGFTWFPFQPKSAPGIGWWLMHWHTEKYNKNLWIYFILFHFIFQ